MSDLDHQAFITLLHAHAIQTRALCPQLAPSFELILNYILTNLFHLKDNSFFSILASLETVLQQSPPSTQLVSLQLTALQKSLEIGYFIYLFFS